MKFTIVALFCLVGLAAAGNFSESPLRLPLPDEIKRLHPELINERITYDSPLVKVVGGTNVADGEVPYQIALLRSNSFTCGGSWIGTNTVLTAAHCVSGGENSPSMFGIRYGSIDRTKGPMLAASKIISHPNYSSSTIDYDVAIIKTVSDFTPSANAATIPMATSIPDPSAQHLLSGWGRLSSGGSLPTTCQKATTLAQVSKADCQKAWGSINSITDRMYCAHSTTQSACNGDSGGPLVSGGVLVGVVSWGPSTCMHSSYTNVYANVVNLRQWILANMQ